MGWVIGSRLEEVALEECVWICSICYQGCEEVRGDHVVNRVEHGVYVHEDQYICDNRVIKPLCVGEWGSWDQALEVLVGDATDCADGRVGRMVLRAEKHVFPLFLWCEQAEWVLCVGSVMASVLSDLVGPDTPGRGRIVASQHEWRDWCRSWWRRLQRIQESSSMLTQLHGVVISCCTVGSVMGVWGAMIASIVPILAMARFSMSHIEVPGGLVAVA